MEQKPTRRGASVDALIKGNEIHTECFEVVRQIDEVTYAPREPIEPPHGDSIEPSSAGICQKTVESRAA